jgi:flagellar hook-basal body complex protein FliE
MSVTPIAAISSSITPALDGVAGATGPAGIGPSLDTDPLTTGEIGASGFGDIFTSQLTELDATIAEAEQLSRVAAVGGDVDLAELMTKTSEAQLMLETTVAIRDRAVNAFNEIMGMGS